MFRAPLCPSSKARGRILLNMVFSTQGLAGVLGGRKAGRVHSVDGGCYSVEQQPLHCAHDLPSGFLRLQPAHSPFGTGIIFV